MNEGKDFSLEDSEELINNLAANPAPELEKLRSALNLLSHVHELSPISLPPLLPSKIRQPDRILARHRSKSRRTVITSILSVGILASASLAAAAVTGRGPAPIVNVGHQSAKLVKAVAGAISKAVTGKDINPSVKSPAPANDPARPNDSGGEKDSKGSPGDSENSLTGPSSVPTSDSDSKDGDEITISVPVLPTLSPDLSDQQDSKKNSVKKPEENQKDHGTNESSRTPTEQPTPEPTHVELTGIPIPTLSFGEDSSDGDGND